VAKRANGSSPRSICWSGWAESLLTSAAQLLAQSSTPPSANANPAVVKRAKDSWPADLAAAYPPAKGPHGIPVWRDDKNRENFYAVAHKAMVYANWAAPYQDPLPGDRCGLRIQRCLRVRAVDQQRCGHPRRPERTNTDALSAEQGILILRVNPTPRAPCLQRDLLTGPYYADLGHRR
jgi:hypothetical protein